MPLGDRRLQAETRVRHAGQIPDRTTGSRAGLRHQTTSYRPRDAGHAANLFDLREFANLDTRLMNPTTAVFEKRVAALDGAAAALATASGLAILNIAQAGDDIVSADNLYGGTDDPFHDTPPRLGITARTVPSNNLGAVQAAITGRNAS